MWDVCVCARVLIVELYIFSNWFWQMFSWQRCVGGDFVWESLWRLVCASECVCEVLKKRVDSVHLSLLISQIVIPRLVCLCVCVCTHVCVVWFHTNGFIGVLLDNLVLVPNGGVTCGKAVLSWEFCFSFLLWSVAIVLENVGTCMGNLGCFPDEVKGLWKCICIYCHLCIACCF